MKLQYIKICKVYKVELHNDIFLFISTALPTNIRVLEAYGRNIIYGLEYEMINLTCQVDSGEPKGTLNWRVNNTIVLTGGPESIVYSLLLTEVYDGENFTCATENSLSNETISITVQLRLISKY